MNKYRVGQEVTLKNGKKGIIRSAYDITSEYRSQYIKQYIIYAGGHEYELCNDSDIASLVIDLNCPEPYYVPKGQNVKVRVWKDNKETTKDGYLCKVDHNYMYPFCVWNYGKTGKDYNYCYLNYAAYKHCELITDTPENPLLTEYRELADRYRQGLQDIENRLNELNDKMKEEEK
jgi:hypothetical protein